MNLSPNRAERFGYILNRFRCPSANQGCVMFASATAGDMADFTNVQNRDGWKQISYLSPADFHHHPHGLSGAANAYRGVQLRTGFDTPVAINMSYRPRMERVGLQP